MVAAVSRPGVACVALAAVLALGGCGYDAGALEDDIAAGFGPELRKFDVKAESVVCPEEVEEEAGYRFECMLTTDEDQHLPVAVVVNEDSDFEYRLTSKANRELVFGDIGRDGKPGS